MSAGDRSLVAEVTPATAPGGIRYRLELKADGSAFLSAAVLGRDCHGARAWIGAGYLFPSIVLGSDEIHYRAWQIRGGSVPSDRKDADRARRELRRLLDRTLGDPGSPAQRLEAVFRSTFATYTETAHADPRS